MVKKSFHSEIYPRTFSAYQEEKVNAGVQAMVCKYGMAS